MPLKFHARMSNELQKEFCTLLKDVGDDEKQKVLDLFVKDYDKSDSDLKNALEEEKKKGETALENLQAKIKEKENEENLKAEEKKKELSEFLSNEENRANIKRLFKDLPDDALAAKVEVLGNTVESAQWLAELGKNFQYDNGAQGRRSDDGKVLSHEDVVQQELEKQGIK